MFVKVGVLQTPTEGTLLCHGYDHGKTLCEFFFNAFCYTLGYLQFWYIGKFENENLNKNIKNSFLYCAQGLHDFEGNVMFSFNSNYQF